MIRRLVIGSCAVAIGAFFIAGCEPTGRSSSDIDVPQVSVPLASDYGVTDPSKAALVIIDSSAVYQVDGVMLQVAGTYYGCNYSSSQSMGKVPEGGQRVFTVAPGSYGLTISAWPAGLSHRFIVVPSTTCKSFEVAAGKAEVLTLSGGTWDGKSGALPNIR